MHNLTFLLGLVCLLSGISVKRSSWQRDPKKTSGGIIKEHRGDASTNWALTVLVENLIEFRNQNANSLQRWGKWRIHPWSWWQSHVCRMTGINCPNSSLQGPYLSSALQSQSYQQYIYMILRNMALQWLHMNHCIVYLICLPCNPFYTFKPVMEFSQARFTVGTYFSLHSCLNVFRVFRDSTC